MSYNDCLIKLMKKIPKEQLHSVFNQGMCDIDCSFIGFIETYYHLSKIIDKEFTVIDFGAAYNPQCFFFDRHKKYIAVQPEGDECKVMFQAKNCDIYKTTTKGFIENVLPGLNLDLDKTFAIVNFVPNWHGENSMELARTHFKKVYTYYP